MTASLPDQVQSVFARFLTTELTTVDAGGQPITWPVTPYYQPGAPCIDVTTGLGYPKKANDARANSRVSLLFSDPTGSGLDHAPTVLVQGSAQVDDRDLEANAERYARETTAKLPGSGWREPPGPLRGLLAFYYARIYIHVRPERVYMWPADQPDAEPELFDCHLEEVRSGHSEEPEDPPGPLEGGMTSWDDRIYELGTRYPRPVLSVVCPDGFPFSARVRVRHDPAARWLEIKDVPDGVPLSPGRACLTAHRHDPQMRWQENFQVRGDLEDDDGRWTFLPHRLVGGFELPESRWTLLRTNAAKARRFQRAARRELARRHGHAHEHAPAN